MKNRPNYTAMKRRNNYLAEKYKAQGKYTNKFTPYLIALFCLALKHSTNMSNEDIEAVVDAFNDECQNAYDVQSVFERCKNEVGLDLYAESDKARVNA